MRALSLFALMWLSGPAAAADLSVRDAWIPEAPPTATVMAGYLSLHNASDAPKALVGVDSPAFERVEMHRSVYEGGVAKMQRQARIEVPAGGMTVLRPGDYHLMLMQPRQALKDGDSVPLVLELDDGSRVEASAEIRRPQHGGHGGHHH